MSDENSVANDSLFYVTGGRDYNLLKLIAKKLNFNINYVDPLERTQGSSIIEADTDNLTFSGALGKIQRRVRYSSTSSIQFKIHFHQSSGGWSSSRRRWNNIWTEKSGRVFLLHSSRFRCFCHPFATQTKRSICINSTVSQRGVAVSHFNDSTIWTGILSDHSNTVLVARFHAD